MQETGFQWGDLATWVTAGMAFAALALEVRRWFETGVKLSLTFMVDAITIPEDGKTYIVITVANRGDTPTTLTNLAFQAYDSRWMRFRGKAKKSFIANNPSPAQPFPHMLPPGGRWMGMCIQNEMVEPLLASGLLWAEVYATHADKPTSVRLRRRPQPKGTKLEGPPK